MAKSKGKKEHKHRWFETTVCQNSETQKSYGCKCGCWKIENKGVAPELKIVNWKIIRKLKGGHYKLN